MAAPRTPVIYEVVRRLGEDEMARALATSLWWSGVAAGLINQLLVAGTGHSGRALSAGGGLAAAGIGKLRGYCVGFLMVVLSRNQQLFTESTITAR